MQDYRTGDWKIMNEAESKEYVRTRLFLGDGTVWVALKEEIDRLLDEHRFGVSRKTRSMSWNSQHFLARLAKDLFPSFPNIGNTKTREGATLFPLDNQDRLLRSISILPKSFLPATPKTIDKNGVRSFLLGHSLPSLHVGQEIYWIAQNEMGFNKLFAGIILGISTKRGKNGHRGYDVAFYDNGVQNLGRTDGNNIPLSSLLPREPISEGSVVTTSRSGREKLVKGVILLVQADGSIDVQYEEDGVVETHIGIDQYNSLPYDNAYKEYQHKL